MTYSETDDSELIELKNKSIGLEPPCSILDKLNGRAIHGFFIAYVIFTCVSLYLTWWTALEYSAQIVGVSAFLPLVVPILICTALFVLLLLRWRQLPERVFVLLALPALGMFALFVVPNQIPDEIWHIYKIFDLQFSGYEMLVPESIARQSLAFPTNYQELYACLNAQPDWENTVAVYRDLSVYLVHLYALPGLVVRLCACLNLNPLSAIILARLVNAALFLIAGYWIVRHVPLGKTMAVVFLLNPMLLQQEASCSADVIVNISSLMFLAYVLELKFQEERSRPRQIALLAALFIIASISKFVYVLLGYMLLLLVPRLSKSKTRRLVYVITAGGTLLVATVVVLFYGGGSFSETFELIRNPPELIKVLAKSYYEIGPIWIRETFGEILGALNIPVWVPCFWVYCLILVLSAVFNLGERLSFARSERVFIFAFAFIAITATILLFRGWTIEADLRTDVIMGAQGRYFIPFIFVPFLSLVSARSSMRKKNILVVYACVLIFVLLMDTVSIVSAFI